MDGVMVDEKVVLADEVLDEFIYLMENVRDSQFRIGDMLIELVAMHGGKKAEVINQVAGKLNVNASLLYDYYRVSEKWDIESRAKYQALDWTIYRNSDPELDVELLDKAIDYGWNATKFKQEKYPAIIEPVNMIKRILSWIKELWERPISDEHRDELKGIHHRLMEIMEDYAD